MALKILIVEDQIEQLDYLELAMRQFWCEQNDSWRLDKLHIDRAAAAVDARRLLTCTAERSEDYDLMLLDLGLPENPGEKEQTDLGLQLIEISRNAAAANRILVISAFQDFSYVVPAFQRGANDFIKKPFDKRELFHRVNLLLTGLLDEARQTALDRRQRELAPYVWKYIAHRFSACFGDFIQAVRNETDLLNDELSERFGLSRIGTSQDPIIKCLRAISESSQTAHDEWTSLQEAFDRTGNQTVSWQKISRQTDRWEPDDTPAELAVERWLAKTGGELRHCLNVNLSGNPDLETRVLSIGGNWQTAMREVLLGGLSTPQNQHSDQYSDQWWGSQVSVSTRTHGELAEVLFEDNLPAIPPELADKINRGENILPNEGPWRAWGLGIVQHIASLGGGKLSVRPSAREKGNTISLFIPQTAP
ncbi:MAG TPA: response regulator [Blastocatellia bacterium]